MKNINKSGLIFWAFCVLTIVILFLSPYQRFDNEIENIESNIRLIDYISDLPYNLFYIAFLLPFLLSLEITIWKSNVTIMPIIILVVQVILLLFSSYIIIFQINFCLFCGPNTYLFSYYLIYLYLFFTLMIHLLYLIPYSRRNKIVELLLNKLKLVN